MTKFKNATLMTTDGEKKIFKNGKCQIKMKVYNTKGEFAHELDNFFNLESAEKTYKDIVSKGYPAPTLWIDNARVFGY